MAKYDGFKNWTAVAGEFSGHYDWDEERKTKALAKISEPEEVLVACYHHESYEGDAWVVFRNGDKYYTVDGGHCSCHGLEGQWKPEEYESAEALLASLNKGAWNDTYGARGKYIEMVRHILQERVKP